MEKEICWKNGKMVMTSPLHDLTYFLKVTVYTFRQYDMASFLVNASFKAVVSLLISMPTDGKRLLIDASIMN